MSQAGRIERFAGQPDRPRLPDIVVPALCVLMPRAEGWVDIQNWGREREACLRCYLLLHNGMPGHDTIRQVFESRSPTEREQRFAALEEEACPAVKGRATAVDSKALPRATRAVDRSPVRQAPRDRAPFR